MSRARDLADRVLHNRTHEDTEGGRESIVTFKGEQSGGEISTLAQIQASHDGTADDQKSDLIFKTNDGSDGASPTERLRIDSEGHVGINIVPTNTLVVSETTTPTIQIKDGQASGTRVSGKLHIGEADTLGVSIENSTTSYNDNCAMVVKTSPAAGTLTTRLRIDEHGIKFGSDTAEANGLNDYEEGTFTPQVGGQNTTGSATYIKIGEFVHINIDITVASGISATNQITNLPYIVVSGFHSAFATGYTNTANSIEGGYFDAGSTVMKCIAAGGSSSVNINQNERLILFGTYRTT